MTKKLFCIVLSLLTVLSLLPAAAAAEQPDAAAGGASAVRGVLRSVIIDDDPADGYEGDYVVIYNPSTTASSSCSTGNLTGLIETTVEPAVLPGPENRQAANADLPIWKIDIDALLDKPESPKTKRDPSLVKATSYAVGDKKTFEILGQYSPTGSDSMEFECLYVGAHCYIWTPVSSANNTYPLDEIDESYAKMAADEFDSKFDLMQSSFGDHETGSGDGKLHILYYNIDEGWNGSGGYVAGFFYAYDLYYNNLPILNIDTYPGVYYKNPNSGNVYKRMNDTYNTMVHEYQHLINYSNTGGMATWLNECFSAAAEEICYPGSSVVSRIQSWENYYYSSNNNWLNPPAEFEYQSSFNLHNGYSMYNWSNGIDDVLALYAQVSFFAQYLYTQFGNTIYRQISDAYTSSEVNAITSATGVNCAELVRDFRVAVTANAAQDQYGGIYGFRPQNGYDPSQYHNVQNPWDLLSPVIFTGNVCAIKGGGAITIKPVDGVFNPPSDADPNLVYIGIKIASPYTVTAFSNNDAWGTVSVEDTKITAAPADGYYAADYEVVSGTATAVIHGNVIRVTPESDCTIKVIFAPKPRYTVSYVVSGSAQGQTTALHGDTITLPSSVTVNPDGWTYIGWTDTEIHGETETKPVYYAPGADYTVTADVTLYAVYSRVEEGVGAPVYELVSSAPSDWSGNYVITYRTVNSSSSPMYVMKGVSVGSDGAAIEGTYNCDQYAVTGAVLNGTTLSDVADSYVFTMEPHGAYYSIQNVATGTYLGENTSSYLAGYRTYSTGYCDWTPGTKANASSATYAKGGNYPMLSMYIDGPYFWAGSSNNSSALYVRFWKETAGDATYYTTDPVSDHEHTFTHVAGVAPTCTADGNIEYWYCPGCGRYFSDGQGANEISQNDIRISALGHNWSAWAVTTPPTCTADGVETHTCARCSASETRAVNALGHDLTHHEGKAPTCTESGWAEYDTCSRCDYSTYAALEALGHDYGEPVYTWTKTETGYTVTASVVCANDRSHTISETVTADYEVVTPPAPGTPGLGRYTATFTDARFAAQTLDVAIAAILPGDANCDGRVSAADAAFILRSLVDLSKLSAEGTANAEVNGDGEITAQDAAAILRYIVKLIPSLPCV